VSLTAAAAAAANDSNNNIIKESSGRWPTIHRVNFKLFS
jgi:hypothetical protein